MIAISDILIFIAGGIFVYVAILTRNRIYGKHKSVLKLIQQEEDYKPRKVETDIPPVDVDRFNKLISQINTADEFQDTYSRRIKERD